MKALCIVDGSVMMLPPHEIVCFDTACCVLHTAYKHVPTPSNAQSVRRGIFPESTNWWTLPCLHMHNLTDVAFPLYAQPSKLLMIFQTCGRQIAVSASNTFSNHTRAHGTTCAECRKHVSKRCIDLDTSSFAALCCRQRLQDHTAGHKPGALRLQRV